MSKPTEKTIFWQDYQVTKSDRNRLMSHGSFLVWFTGMSGAGKSTIANLLEVELYKMGLKTYLLDGDNLRKGLNSDLGFSNEDRSENIRRVGEVSKLMLDAGLVTLASFVSPILRDRELVKALVGDGSFIEVYVKCPLEICETRDPKGLYKKARNREVTLMTGVDSSYEEPVNPALILETDKRSRELCVQSIIKYLVDNGYIERSSN